MYTTHQKQIELWCNGSPDNTYKTIEFVMATINRKFALVPMVLSRYANGEAKHGFSAMQVRGLELMHGNRKAIYKAIQAKKHDPIALMQYLVTLPGIGIPKAGFVAQLVTGQIGCFDVWNMKDTTIASLLGVHAIDRNIMKIDTKTKEETVIKKLMAYVGMCATLGSAFLWDNWCATLAQQYVPGHFFYPWKTAEAVSQFHVDTCIR